MIWKRTEFLVQANLDDDTLAIWLAEHWLEPVTQEGLEVFSDADLARARLISELRKDFGVNDAGVGVALHLLDQLHGLRAALFRMEQRK